MDDRANLYSRTGLFMPITFIIPWRFELAVALTIGHKEFLAPGLAPWSMFFPAVVALSLQLFSSSDSPIYICRYWGRPVLIPE